MWTGLDLDLGHDPVAADVGDDPGKMVASRLSGQRQRGFRRNDLEGDSSQFGAVDHEAAGGVVGDLHAAEVGPAA